jgi:hypothetical protein
MNGRLLPVVVVGGVPVVVGWLVSSCVANASCCCRCIMMLVGLGGRTNNIETPIMIIKADKIRLLLLENQCSN